jgi:hypothetical protein
VVSNKDDLIELPPFKSKEVLLKLLEEVVQDLEDSLLTKEAVLPVDPRKYSPLQKGKRL